MKKLLSYMCSFLCMGLLYILPSMASEVDIVDVQAELMGENSWRFSVTLHHADTGWDHYASVWRVLADDKQTVLGERLLAHPHIHEMPFTRSQDGIRIPADMTHVYIVADDNIGEGASKLYRFELLR